MWLDTMQSFNALQLDAPWEHTCSALTITEPHDVKIAFCRKNSNLDGCGPRKWCFGFNFLGPKKRFLYCLCAAIAAVL